MYIRGCMRSFFSPVNRAGDTLRLQWVAYPCRTDSINNVDVHLPSIIRE